MSVPIIPTCPTDCSSIIPDVEFSECSPKVLFGEIKNIYIAAINAADFTDIESLAEWATRLNQTGGSVDSIRKLTVAGDMPLPDSTEIVGTGGRKFYPPKNWTVNFDIDDNTDSNYEFARTTGCNQRYKMWIEADNYIYGGATGIECDMQINPSIERGLQSIHKLVGKITWSSKFAPERHDSPFAE